MVTIATFLTPCSTCTLFWTVRLTWNHLPIYYVTWYIVDIINQINSRPCKYCFAFLGLYLPEVRYAWANVVKLVQNFSQILRFIQKFINFYLITKLLPQLVDTVGRSNSRWQSVLLVLYSVLKWDQFVLNQTILLVISQLFFHENSLSPHLVYIFKSFAPIGLYL